MQTLEQSQALSMDKNTVTAYRVSEIKTKKGAISAVICERFTCRQQNPKLRDRNRRCQQQPGFGRPSMFPKEGFDKVIRTTPNI